MAGTNLCVVLSFLLPVCLIAPFAFQLTRVTRMPLPLETVESLSKTVRLEKQMHLLTNSSSMKIIGADTHIQSLPSLPFIYSASEIEFDEQMRDIIQQIKLDDQFVVAMLCQSKLSQDIVVGQYRHAWTGRCTLSLEEQKYIKDLVMADAIKENARISLKYRVSLTLLHSDPTTSDFNAIPSRALQVLERFLHKLSGIAHFTLESQKLYYTKLVENLQYAAESKQYFVTTNDLQQFKSINDFSTVSVLEDREQVLHFMAYVPDKQFSNLSIRSDTKNNGKSFEIPGWGGVTIANPTINAEFEALETVQTFIAQFRHLLGIPNARYSKLDNLSISFLPATSSGITDWELDIIIRSWLKLHVVSTVNMLQASTKLITEMPHMSVLPSIQQNVENAIQILTLLSDQKLSSASDCKNALALVRSAMESAESVYYDPTMVPQLYFPPEHLYAVYLPLLAPLALPLIAGLIREYKRYKKLISRKQV